MRFDSESGTALRISISKSVSGVNREALIQDKNSQHWRISNQGLNRMLIEVNDAIINIETGAVIAYKHNASGDDNNPNYQYIIAGLSSDAATDDSLNHHNARRAYEWLQGTCVATFTDGDTVLETVYKNGDYTIIRHVLRSGYHIHRDNQYLWYFQVERATSTWTVRLELARLFPTLEDAKDIIRQLKQAHGAASEAAS